MLFNNTFCQGCQLLYSTYLPPADKISFFLIFTAIKICFNILEK